MEIESSNMTNFSDTLVTKKKAVINNQSLQKNQLTLDATCLQPINTL